MLIKLAHHFISIMYLKKITNFVVHQKYYYYYYLLTVFYKLFFSCKAILLTLFSAQFICIFSQFLFPFFKQFFVALHLKCIMIHVILLIISIVHVWIYIAGVKVLILSYNIYNAFIIFSQNHAF